MPRKKKEEETAEEPKPEAEKTQQAKEEKKDEKKELIDTLQRLQAEFENYKKRVDKENCELIRCANEDLIIKILPIIDNFELALKSCRAKDDFYKGMELIYSQLMDTLHSQGLKNIECIGKKFDPYYHEVLLVEENDKEENTIIEELQKGYLLNDKVIRHSKVKVAKKKKQASEKLAVLQSSALGTTKPKVSLVPENKSFLKEETKEEKKEENKEEKSLAGV